MFCHDGQRPQQAGGLFDGYRFLHQVAHGPLCDAGRIARHQALQHAEVTHEVEVGHQAHKIRHERLEDILDPDDTYQ